MKLSEINDNNFYEIIQYKDLTKEEIETFYKQGLIEGTLIKINKDVKTTKNIILLISDTTTYAFDKKYAQNIEVKKCNIY